MTNQILLGNAVSFAAAILLGLSCWTKHPKRVFAYQIGDNMLLVLSSIIFASYSAAATNTMATLRCLFIVTDRYDRKAMGVFLVVSVALGLLFNSRGAVGLLPVIATAQFTICNYLFKEIKGVKISLIVNLVMWVVYAFVIRDYASGIAWSITIGVTAVSLARILIAEHRQA